MGGARGTVAEIPRGRDGFVRSGLGAPTAVEIVYETHTTTIDNEAGLATGRLPGLLSPERTAVEEQLFAPGRGRHGLPFGGPLVAK